MDFDPNRPLLFSSTGGGDVNLKDTLEYGVLVGDNSVVANLEGDQ